MSNMSYLTAAQIVLDARFIWPPSNAESVREAICVLLDEEPGKAWLQSRLVDLVKQPEQELHAASFKPQTKLSVRWNDTTLWFDSYKATALAETFPEHRHLSWHPDH